MIASDVRLYRTTNSGLQAPTQNFFCGPFSASPDTRATLARVRMPMTAEMWREGPTLRQNCGGKAVFARVRCAFAGFRVRYSVDIACTKLSQNLRNCTMQRFLPYVSMLKTGRFATHSGQATSDARPVATANTAGRGGFDYAAPRLDCRQGRRAAR